MNRQRLAAGGAAAVIAAGIAIGAAAAPVSAASPAPQRITSTQQLGDSLRAAVAAEQQRDGVLSDGTVGKAAMSPSSVSAPAC
jgi:hypothetical protein